MKPALILASLTAALLLMACSPKTTEKPILLQVKIVALNHQEPSLWSDSSGYTTVEIIGGDGQRFKIYGIMGQLGDIFPTPANSLRLFP